MGRGKKSLLGFLGFKKTDNLREDIENGPSHPRKVRPSDEDRGRWYGEPDIDKKAKEFIDKVHRNMEHDT